MNEQELLDGLRAIRQERTTYPDVAEVHRRVLAIPIEQIPQKPSWLSLFPSWGYRSMSSALKFVAAAAIVALFGGFLLAGILTTPQGDDMAPAAVTESPSPMTSEESLSGMVTEEVEPGVFRVVNDGVRDLPSSGNWDIVAGYDGGVWLLREDEFLRLGSDGSHEWPTNPYGFRPERHAFEVAPDGTKWVIPLWHGEPSGDLRRGDGLRSSDGEEWTRQSCPSSCHGMTVAPDGTVWASWREGSRWRVGHLGPTGWQPLDGASDYEIDRLLFTDAGDLYGFSHGWDISLYRHEDGVWQSRHSARDLVDVGPDGTVWQDAGSGDFRDQATPFGQDGLARFVGGESAAWTSADLPEISLGFGRDYEFKAAPDGSLWFSLWRSADGRDPREDEAWEPEGWRWAEISAPIEPGHLACDGLARFDGETLDRFLPGRCITIDIASDGSVWLIVFDGEEWERQQEPGSDLYAITPEAITTTE